MAISLSKGGNVSLSKEAPGLDAIMVGLGWDVRATDGQDFDLDASAFLLNASGKVRNDSDFCFYNNKIVAGGAAEHQGDNRTGEGEGDDALPVAVHVLAVDGHLGAVAQHALDHGGDLGGRGRLQLRVDAQ